MNISKISSGNFCGGKIKIHSKATDPLAPSVNLDVKDIKKIGYNYITTKDGDKYQFSNKDSVNKTTQVIAAFAALQATPGDDVMIDLTY